MLRRAAGQSGNKKVDAEPGQNRKNSSPSSHTPQEEQVFPWDLLMECRYRVTAARFPPLPLPPNTGCLIRPCKTFFLRADSERWKQYIWQHRFGPHVQQAATPAITPLEATAQLTARGAMAGTASPSSIQNGEGPARRPARPGAGRPTQEEPARHRGT